MDAKRAPNFTEKEVDLLLGLVEKYKSTIENRKTDTVTNNDKNSAWENIQLEFNFKSDGVTRTTKILREKYNNLKKTKRFSGIQSTNSEIDFEIIDIVKNELDSDEDNTEDKQVEIIEKVPLSEPSYNGKWARSCKKMGSTRGNFNRTRRNKNDFVSLNEIQKARLELIKLQQEEIKQNMAMRKMEHEFNLQCKKIEHELRMEELKRRIQNF